jgi:flagellar hook-length control protein FliK
MAQQLKGIETQLKTIMEQQQQLQASPQTQAEAIKTTLDFNVVKPVAPIIVEPGKLNAPMIQGETAAGEMANVKVAAETPAQNLNQQDGQFSLLDQKTTAATTPTPNLEANNSQQFTLPTENAAPTPSDKLPNPAEAAPPKPAANFTAPRDDYQIKNQIVAQAALINRSAQESEMVIRLKPQHLGEMALKVTVNNGIVNAAIHTNNAEVRGILENSLHQLKQDLANVGLKVDNVSISAGLSQFAADQERAMQWQQSQRFSSSRKGGESYEDALDSIAATQTVVNSSTQDGVDYRI